MDNNILKISDSKHKQDDNMKARMEGTNTTTTTLTDPSRQEEMIFDHESRITTLEIYRKQDRKDINQQKKDIQKIDLGNWEILNKMNTNLNTLITELSNIGIINGNQDKDIDCLKQELKDRTKDKKQSRRSLRDIGIGAFLTFVFLVILSYIIPGVLKYFHL